MKTIAIRLLCLSPLLLNAPAFAAYSSVSNQAQYGSVSNQNVYSSSISNEGYSSSISGREPGVSFYMNTPEFSGGFVIGGDGSFVRALAGDNRLVWATDQIYFRKNTPGAVIGGEEHGRPLYVCRANFNNALLPGKIVNGKCNIALDGREYRVSRFQVLISNRHLNWVPASFGSKPVNALNVGFLRGQDVSVCQAQFAGGMQPGKVFNRACYISYAGREIEIPFYNVLTV